MINFRLNDFSFDRFLGKGSFGNVYLARKNGTNKEYAIKQMPRNNPKIEKNLQNEIGILKNIKHNNIINYVTTIPTFSHYFIITEYCNGGTLTQCLLKYIEIYGRAFPEGIVQYLMRQIVDAIKYLHNKRIIHRDIKLDNILVHFENEYDKINLNMLKATIKIIDFGISKYLDPSGLRHSISGSLDNMDPIILKSCYEKARFKISKLLSYNEKADIYSLGTVCYELLVGHRVFQNNNNFDLLEKLVEEGNYHVPTYLSKESISFLNGMLQYDCAKRQSAEVLSKHPFLTKNVKDFKSMNFTQIGYKLDGQGLKINIKFNQTIYAIFQGDYQIPFFNIQENYYEKPLPELDDFNQKIEMNYGSNVLNQNAFNNNPNIFINNNALNNNIYNGDNVYIHNNSINNNINNFTGNNYNNSNHKYNNQYGNTGANTKVNYKNMPHYYVDLNANKNNRNKNNNIHQQNIYQQANPYAFPNTNNNIGYQYQQNNQFLNQQYQTNNQILFNNINPQYQEPINAPQPQPQANVFYSPNIQYDQPNPIYSNNAQMNNIPQNQVKYEYYYPQQQMNIPQVNQVYILVEEPINYNYNIYYQAGLYAAETPLFGSPSPFIGNYWNFV